MSRFFVEPNERERIWEFDPETTVSDRAPNWIDIRPRMTYSLSKKVQGKMLGLAGDGKTVELRFGDDQIALLQFNILDWGGPDFEHEGKKIPCTPDNIARIAGMDAFIDRVADEIARRNKPPESPDPKLAATNGSTSDGAGSSDIPASTSSLSASAISTSSLPRNTTGRPNKLIDVTPSS